MPSGPTSTIGSGAVSSTALSFSSAFLRSEMSRMMPLKKRLPAVSHMRERELERELAAVLAQADDLDGLADQRGTRHAALRRRA